MLEKSILSVMCVVDRFLVGAEIMLEMLFMLYMLVSLCWVSVPNGAFCSISSGESDGFEITSFVFPDRTDTIAGVNIASVCGTKWLSLFI